MSILQLTAISYQCCNGVAQETWKGLERAVDEGLVRSIGLSNFSPEKTDKWLKDARIKPAVNQVKAHSLIASTVRHG